MNETPEHRVHLGRQIRALRRERSLSQEQLGALAGVSYKFLGEVERGTKGISFDVLVKVAAALAVDMAELVTYPGSPVDRAELLRAAHDCLEEFDDSRLARVVRLLTELRR